MALDSFGLGAVPRSFSWLAQEEPGDQITSIIQWSPDTVRYKHTPSKSSAWKPAYTRPVDPLRDDDLPSLRTDPSEGDGASEYVAGWYRICDPGSCEEYVDSPDPESVRLRFCDR
jgi:hypothetical protein